MWLGNYLMVVWHRGRGCQGENAEKVVNGKDFFPEYYTGVKVKGGNGQENCACIFFYYPIHSR